MFIVAIIILQAFFCYEATPLPLVLSDDRATEVVAGVTSRCISVGFHVVELQRKLCTGVDELEKQVITRFANRYAHWAHAAWYKAACANLTSTNCNQCFFLDGSSNYIMESCLSVNFLQEEFCPPESQHRTKRSLTDAEVLQDLSGLTTTMGDMNSVVHQEVRAFEATLLELENEENDQLFKEKTDLQTAAIRTVFEKLSRASFMKDEILKNHAQRKRLVELLMQNGEGRLESVPNENVTVRKLNGSLLSVCLKRFPHNSRMQLYRFQSLPVAFEEGFFQVQPCFAFGIVSSQFKKLIPAWLGQKLHQLKYTTFSLEELKILHSGFQDHTEQCFFSSLSRRTSEQRRCVLDVKKVTNLQPFYINVLNGSIWAPAQTVIFQRCNVTEALHVNSNTLINTNCNCRYSANGKVYVRKSRCDQDFSTAVVTLDVLNLAHTIKESAKIREVADAIQTNVPHSKIVNAVDSILQKVDLETVNLKKALNEQIKQHNAELGLFGIPKNILHGTLGGGIGVIVTLGVIICVCKMLKLQRGL